MSQTYSYTVYIPASSGVAFPIAYTSLPAPQSQVFQQIQITRQIQSTPDSATALGLGTQSAFRTVVVDQQGQVNYIQLSLLNFNGVLNGENIPPKGVLAINTSLLNQTPAPTSPSDVVRVIIPPGEQTVTFEGVVDTALCSGAYFGASGKCIFTNYVNQSPYKLELIYTLPSP